LPTRMRYCELVFCNGYQQDRLRDDDDDDEVLKLNLLKTKRRLLYLKTQFIPRSKHFSKRKKKPVTLCYMGQKSLFVLR
jgi:hypothetical protein